MVSLRFPFSFSQPKRLGPPLSKSTTNATSRAFSAAATTVACSVAAAATVAGVAISQNPSIPFVQNALNSLLSRFSPDHSHFQSQLMWGSLSLADNSSPVTESRTGFSFPAILEHSQRLLGIGLRKKSVLGLKNIDVYAFGVYVDDNEVKNVLAEKYGALSASGLLENMNIHAELMENDISMTIRLQIVYGKLSIRSVRSAFEESVASRLRKFGGSDNKELLQRFTSQFKDEYKVPRRSVIDLSREKGYILTTRIDGKEVGSIQSSLLCRSILDLYIGEDPFDTKAKEDVEVNLASLLRK